MTPILFWPLLTLTCGYALVRGGFYERAVALICLAATFVSIGVHPSHGRYEDVAWGELIVDSFVLTSFIAIALLSDRFWPLWVAGLQLTSSLGHFFKIIDPDLLPHAYAGAIRFWSYPILIILFVGSWRSYRRRLEERRLRTA